MIFTSITWRIRETGHLSKTKIDLMMSKLRLSKTYMYCLDLSIYSVLSILWGSIEDTSITSLYWKRTKDNCVHCNLEFATAVVCKFCFCNMILFIIFPCPLVRDFSLLQFSTSLSNKNRIKSTLRRVTWCGLVVGQKKSSQVKMVSA